MKTQTLYMYVNKAGSPFGLKRYIEPEWGAQNANSDCQCNITSTPAPIQLHTSCAPASCLQLLFLIIKRGLSG